MVNKCELIGDLEKMGKQRPVKVQTRAKEREAKDDSQEK